MYSINLKEMKVSAENVVIDGNKDACKIITSIPGESGSVITVSGKNSELKHLKVVTTGNADFGKQAGKIITLSGKNSKRD